MSQSLFDRSPDLAKLRYEGYDVEIKSGHLLLKDVPYVNSNKQIARGILVAKITAAGDVASAPGDHVAYFIGAMPCRDDGAPIAYIHNSSQHTQLATDLIINHTFSAKPQPSGKYVDFYQKMTTYAAILTSYAQVIDSQVSPKTFPVTQPVADDGVFNYLDSASARAGISAITSKLALDSVAIVGLGGTGSYVLDLVAKTPVRAIHIFDGDEILNHNAFRSPGAPSLEELRAKPKKVNYLRAEYSKMHRNIISHDCYIDASNVSLLDGMRFVFLCMDKGEEKRPIIAMLESQNIPFIDVGMGVDIKNGSLLGILRVTASTPEKRDHVWSSQRIPLAGGNDNDDYASNIQIADLNALNAALAVIKWKKLFGFYHDLEKEHFSTYTISGNSMTNEDSL